MTKIAIIGATGSLGRVVVNTLLNNSEMALTLMSRSVDRLPDHEMVTKVTGSVTNGDVLDAVLQGQDLVFVALSGDLTSMVQSIIESMNRVGTKRIIFISSYGIYGELPGQNSRVDSSLRPYRQAADLLETSGLGYTILRPGWFDNSNDISYELIDKGQVIYGNTISRKAIANYVAHIAENPDLDVKENYGIVRE
ncbi:NAD(P)H-binding protein [Streptococcus cristatus]|uniref:Putative oxidoreductase n=1 Tax=Streptococcus cristatus TaxID=45634 RepID=A0A139N516_STRCR|nr:NAD(P)H-binding protein [Streptococcus cristatus]KXT70894.1 putative oxidoreductase [Streptococcus cristatus]